MILAIESNLFVHIASCKSAWEIWQKLKEMFEDKGLTRRIGLLRTLITTNLENSDGMEDFISKIIGTANKLNGIGFEISEEYIGSFLLAGLTSEYKPFIMGIESSGVKITGDSIKSRLFEMTSGNGGKLSQAFLGKQPQKPKLIKCHSCGKVGHKRFQCWHKNKKIPDKNNTKTNIDNVFSAVLMASGKSEESWFLDSGASQHMTSHREWLMHEKESTTKQIYVANNEQLSVECVGDVKLAIGSNQLIVKDVFYVPRLAANLLSVSKINNNGNNVSFDKSGCSIFNNSNQLLARAKLIDGVYKLPATIVSRGLMAKTNLDLVTWHRKLGHLNYQDVRTILNVVDTVKENIQCKVCIKAKQTRLPFKDKGKRATNFLDMIHSDVCGPMENISFGGSRYFVTFIDDYSRKVFVYFMKTKSEVFEKFREFKAMVETQMERKIKIIRSDNGGEYVNNEFINFLKNCGIINQTTIPHTPEQNGIAERMNRTIVERAKCMLFDAGLPKKFWAESVNTAVYLINRSLARGTMKIPEELWTNSAINYDQLKIFGTRALVHIPKSQRQKWDSKSKELIFVGYGEKSKGYRLVEEISGKIVHARDVIFLKEPQVKDDIHSNQKLEINHNFVDNDQKLVNDALEFINRQSNSEVLSTCNTDSSEDNFIVGMESETTSDPDFIPSTQVDEENQEIRRSNRQRQPKRFDDYLTYLVSTTEVSDCPITYQDAISSNEKEWLEAMNNEINSLAENNTWALMDLPKNKRAIKTKWVYKTKRDNNGNVIRFKARLVVKGCSQTPGIDFDETYSPVIRYVSIRFLIALAARHEYKIDQMDAVTAFLQGDLEEEIYIHQPEGFTDGSNKVCKLQKAMYGLKQSGRQWNKKLNAELKLIGLLRSKADPCVYIKQTNNEVTLILAIYVDDILIFWKNETERTRLKDALSKVFKMKYLGPAKNCVGIRMTQDSSGNYYIDQEQ